MEPHAGVESLFTRMWPSWARFGRQLVSPVRAFHVELGRLVEVSDLVVGLETNWVHGSIQFSRRRRLHVLAMDRAAHARAVFPSLAGTLEGFLIRLVSSSARRLPKTIHKALR